jgi:hypothetical protein
MIKLKKLADSIMRNRILFCIVLAAAMQDYAAAGAPDVNTARLVKKVRESENWIHKVDSLYIRMESKWTQIKQVKNVESLQMSERISPSPLQTNSSITATTGHACLLEFAFDQKRARYLNEDPNYLHQMKIWDGSHLTTHEKYIKQPQEQYILESALQGSFPEFLARDTAWPKAQPHSFWFDTRDTAELLSYFGKPEEFVLKGNENYRGVDCLVLEFVPKDVRGPIEDTSAECAKDSTASDADKFGLIGQVQGLADQVYRWYVGKEDGLLHGLAWIINGKTHAEYWMSDYRQIAEGCWFPMIQGYEIAPVDNFLKPLDKTRRDFKTIEIKINEKLPDELFKIELTDGVEVADNRTGRAVIYKYKAPLPGLVGKPMPGFDGIDIKLNDEQLKSKPILVCFVDIDQRPSRNLITELAKKATSLKEKGVEIIAVQISNADKESVSAQIKKFNIPLTTGIINDNDKIKSAWVIKSLPWLILADKEHIVQVEGFSIDDLDAQIGRIQK